MQNSRTTPEYFGEISLLSDDNMTTATAIAKTECQCYTLQVRLILTLVCASLCHCQFLECKPVASCFPTCGDLRSVIDLTSLCEAASPARTR